MMNRNELFIFLCMLLCIRSKYFLEVISQNEATCRENNFFVEWPYFKQISTNVIVKIKIKVNINTSYYLNSRAEWFNFTSLINSYEVLHINDMADRQAKKVARTISFASLNYLELFSVKKSLGSLSWETFTRVISTGCPKNSEFI